MEVHEVFEPAAIVYSYGLAVMGSLTSGKAARPRDPPHRPEGSQQPWQRM
jgi:hypothetical protein